ncbi:helix-turn-helix domain-containing protein [Plantactinospora sp. WMMB782]|uniref:helix-turn-helix domain-containing protein n=1 Tax=Plantactinospora sp. WMMB782 TaxID=3404121 RepID=UPI003B966B01
MTAAHRPACHGKPADWWDTGDDGNRLALALCGVCPTRDGDTCTAGIPDPHPHGVIRAGIAYSDTGRRLPICRCGYPQDDYLGGQPTDCRRCRVPDVPIPDPRRVFRWRVRDLHLAGIREAEMARLLGRSPSTIRAVRTAEGWTRTKADTHAATGRTDRKVA